MVLLRTNIIIIISFIFSSCSPESSTVTIKLRTDTFISSSSSSNNIEKSFLSVGKNSAQEDRIVFKLPTNDSDGDGFFDKCFDDSHLCNIFFIPISIAIKIVSNCSSTGLTSSNLTSAILIFNTNDSSTIAAGSLNLNLLARPWWQTVSWHRAHPFSSEGKWNSLGGDLDLNETFNTNCNGLSLGSCATDEVKFEVTSYFKTLLDGDYNQHYGMIISPNTNINLSTLYSVQADSVYSPRVEATYTCDSSFVEETKTFYLGSSLN